MGGLARECEARAVRAAQMPRHRRRRRHDDGLPEQLLDLSQPALRGRMLSAEVVHPVLPRRHVLPMADRPVFARAATDNIQSFRVLRKCGFKVIGRNRDFANGRVKTRANTFFAWIPIRALGDGAERAGVRTTRSANRPSGH